MTAAQKKSTPAAATAKSAIKNYLRLHITIPSRVCQILRGACACAAVVEILGTAGGIDRGGIPLLPGCVWMAVMLVVLDWGSKPWQG